jgi:hypothetical protein
MIEYIFQGFFAGFGFCMFFIFFLIFVLVLLKKANKKAERTYDEHKLSKAFENYSGKLYNEERYSEIPEVKYIIQELKEGHIPEEVYGYNIKRKNDIALKEGENETQLIRLVERYIVLNKKTEKK